MSASSAPEANKRLYQVLCLPNFSSGDEVRTAYKALALRYHPDKNLDDPTAADKFREVRMAYEVLSNEDRKKKYDLSLRVMMATTGGMSRTRPNLGGGATASGSFAAKAANNPYMSDVQAGIYEELNRYHARQASRTPVGRQPPRTASAGRANKSNNNNNTNNNTSSSGEPSSQYTKEQQELFRKREKERQADLCRQRERERKEQREREHDQLRREQEKQEELLQQRWKQQQQTLNTPTAQAAASRRRGADYYSSNSNSNSNVFTSATHNNFGGGPKANNNNSNTTQVPDLQFRMRTSTPPPSHPSARQGAEFRTPTTVRVGTPVQRSASSVRRYATPTGKNTGRRGTEQQGGSARSNFAQTDSFTNISFTSPRTGTPETRTGVRRRSDTGGMGRPTPTNSSATRKKRNSAYGSPNSPMGTPGSYTPRPAGRKQSGYVSRATDDLHAARSTPAAEKEKERQREARRAEEDRQVQRLARQKRAMERERQAAEEAEEAAAQADPYAFYGSMLADVVLDENCDRTQFIESEETMARRKILRLFQTTAAPTAGAARTASPLADKHVNNLYAARQARGGPSGGVALTADNAQPLLQEEAATRHHLYTLSMRQAAPLSVCAAELSSRQHLYDLEREGRRRLAGSEANASYFVQRVRTMRSALQGHEALQRSRIEKEGVAYLWSLVHVMGPEFIGRKQLREDEAFARGLLLSGGAESLSALAPHAAHPALHTAPSSPKYGGSPPPSSSTSHPNSPPAEKSRDYTHAESVVSDEARTRQTIVTLYDAEVIRLLRLRANRTHHCYRDERRAAVLRAQHKADAEVNLLNERIAVLEAQLAIAQGRK